MTLDEFLKLPESEEDGTHYELDEGKLIRLSPTESPHARRIAKLIVYLSRNLPEDKFDLLTGEVGLILGYDPKPTVRGADIAVTEHLDVQTEGMLREPPLLVIEVISPSNDPADMERKRYQYLAFGIKEVWFVYEQRRTIHVYFSETGVSFVTADYGEFTSTLGFRVDVKELFR